MKKVYFCTIIISIAFIVPACFCDNSFLTVLSNVGCSGFAAAIMAIFLDIVSRKKQEADKKAAKKLYFAELYDQLKMMLERIIWFNDRMEEVQFDWEKDPFEYSSLRYMIWSSQKYKEYDLSEDALKKRLSDISTRFDLDHQKNMNDTEKTKMYRMFCILAASGTEIVRQINTIEKNKLILSSEAYLSLEEIKNLTFNISLAIGLMQSENKNYGVAVSQLLVAYEIVKKTCGSVQTYRIGLHGTIAMNEL